LKVCRKLVEVRNELQTMPLSKSGHNKFAGYKYFELGDFLPAIQGLFKKHGLCDVISFTQDLATMVVYDIEDGSSVTFTSPMGSAQLKGCHEVQNIGAVETYQRRYLYVTALAIVEHDALDAVTGSQAVEVKPVEVKAKPQEPEQNLDALAEVLITFGDTCESLKELSSFWKKNQTGIDQMKVGNPELFKQVQSAFAQYKSKFKE
jgi:translation initiation factor IF-2